MSDEFAYVYVHGFLEHVDCEVGRKVQKHLKAHGISVEIIDAKGGRGYFDSFVSVGLNAVEECYQNHKKPLRLFGFSMGGFISTVYASKHPDRVNRLVLLNPVFNFESSWLFFLSAAVPNATPEATIQKWKEEGQLILQGPEMDQPAPVSYDCFLDSKTYPDFPLVDKSVLVFIGAKDSLMPSDTQEKWKMRQSDPGKVELRALEDDHYFHDDASWKVIVPAILKYLG